MKKQELPASLTCEQVYQIWSTEPDLIRILDFRPKNEFDKSHIPGARNVSLEEFVQEMLSLNNKLAVIVAPSSFREAVETTLTQWNLQHQHHQTEYIFMKDCDNWFITKKPLAGNGIDFVTSSEINKLGEPMKNDTLFLQLFETESSTYTYIIGDKISKEAAIIDPVINTVERDLKLVHELGLRLMYVLDTHIHADHITGADEIRKRTQAKTGVSQTASVTCVDIPLEEGQELTLGNKKIKVIATPGHTSTCLSFYFEGMIFTGDALTIRGTGRTDFQQGSADQLYDSIHKKLFILPDETIVYPGHDYRGMTSSTIELEKKFNPRLGGGKTKEEYKKIMSELKLENPKKIHEAVPANLVCGQVKTRKILHPQVVDGIPEVTCEDVFSKIGQVRIIDVRRPDEFNNELGHIPGAELVTLGTDLTQLLEKGDRSEEIVFTCRSGGRSGQATVESIKLGYKNTMNMIGGMLYWNDIKQPTEKNLQEEK
ncbi:MAG: rhodanese-like domain-containing protein [Pseudobdellovibrionaceae bacterium]